MLPYFLPAVAWLLYCLCLSPRKLSSDRGPALLPFIPLLIIAAARGNVGTDTASYLLEFGLKLSGEDRPFGEFEPGFEFLATAIGWAVHDPRALVAAIALLNGILFLYTTWKWGDYRLVTCAILVPAFYFDFTMNGLRIGTAAPLCLLSILSWEGKHPLRAFVFAVLAVSIQMSSAILFPLLLFYRFNFRALVRYWKPAAVALFAAGVLFFMMFSERVLEKVALYEIAVAPTAYSGLGPLIISVMLLSACVLRSERRTLIYVGLIYLAIQCAFFALTSITYAGIRFQLLALFAQTLFTQRTFKKNAAKSLLTKSWIVCVFLIVTSWKIMGFYGEEGTGASPFMPYHLFWAAEAL